MKSYIVYNSDGIIIRTGVCSQHDLHLQAVDGQFVIEGEADDASQIVVDGEIVGGVLGELLTVGVHVVREEVPVGVSAGQ